MKLKFFFLLLIILLLCFLFSASGQTILSAEDFAKFASDGTVVYSTSFESDEETAGWNGLNFSNDVPEGGGNRSAYISGGCIWPHAWKEIGPLNKAGNYVVRCKAKNIENGGMIGIAHIQDSRLDNYIQVTDTNWASYQTGKQLYCNEGDIIVLSLSSGGDVPAAMLVDMIEVVNISQESSGWKKLNTGSAEKFNDVMVLSETTAFVAGSQGSILKTTDAGSTWLNIAPALPCVAILGIDCVNWRSVRFFNDAAGIAITSSSAFLTTNGGEVWTDITPPGSKFSCIGNTNAGNIYVGDENGYVHNSLDTGKTWSSIQLVLDSTYQAAAGSSVFPVRAIINSPESFDGMSVFALTSIALFSKVQFPGTDWKQIRFLSHYNGPNSQAYDYIITNEGTMFVSGISENTLLDGGPMGLVIRARPIDSHWYQSLVWSEHGILYSLTSPAANVIYTCGDNGIIYKTENNGDTWNAQYTGVATSLYSIDFYNNSGFAVGDSGTIFYTKTGGGGQLNSPPSEYHLITPADKDSMGMPNSLIFTWSKAEDPDNDIIQYTLLFSEDTCKTWASYGPVTNNSINIFGPALPGRFYWTVIANDGINAVAASEVFCFDIVTIAALNTDRDVPESFQLYQNYPNPFNPVTSIKFDVHEEGMVSLRVYDVLGKEAAVLINENKKPGIYTVQWNAENFSSGIYYCAIRAGLYNRVIKLMLIK